jgi:hypothetical protein
MTEENAPTTETTQTSINDAATIEAKKAQTSPPKISAKTTNTQKPIVKVEKRGGINFFTALLMSTASMVGGAYLSLFINSRPDLVQTYKIGAILPKTPAQNNDLTLLQTDITALKQELTKIQTGVPITQNPQIAPPQNAVQPAPAPINGIAPNVAPNSPPQQIANLDPLKEQINGLSGRLTAIEIRLAALDPTGTGGAIIAAMQADIATLKVNYDAINTRVSQTPSPAITFAVMSLAEATNRSGAFVPEFSAVRAALPNVPEVAALEAIAQKGAPTRGILEKEFDALAEYINQEAPSAKQEGGFVGWIRAIFANMIKVEVKEAKPDPNSPNAIYERAKIKIMGGDLQGAVTELEATSIKSPEMIKWLEGAKLRLDLDAKVAALRGAIERGLSVSPINAQTNSPPNPSLLAEPKLQIPQVIAPPNPAANNVAPTNNLTNQTTGAAK